MTFDVNVRERMLKPVGEIFAAVIDPEQMSHYFISGASGPMEAGKTVVWEFADVGAKASVEVLEVETDRKVSWRWGPGGRPMRTSMTFEADGPDATVVTVTESSFELTDEDVKRALGQNAGWIYTLACLKAWVQFGVHLRAGLNKRLTDV
jgi:uncharacterized protein YndB with AHSA1/START domain